MDIKARVKNPYFWIGLLGVILTAMGVEPEMFTSWASVYEAFIDLISNPFMLCSVLVAVLGVFVDPSCKGVCDRKEE